MTTLDAPALEAPATSAGPPPGGRGRRPSPLFRLSAVQRTGAGFAVVIVALAIASVAFPHTSPPGVILQGVELGAVNGLLALGLVLTYRSNRIINFAYGAMGGAAGTFGVMLNLGQHLNWFLSLFLGLLAGGLVGAAVEILVVRRFFRASRLVLTVATIGLAQILGGIQLLLPGFLNGPGLVGGFETPLTSTSHRVTPVLFNGDDLLIVAVVPLVLIGLGWFLLRTDAGVAVRAVADNSDRALLLGIPVRRLSTLVWVVAGVLASLTVMVNAPSQGLTLSAAAGPTLLLPALAAAIVARMESLPTAFVAGVALGIVDSLTRFNVSAQAVSDVAFLLVILGALLLRKNKLSRAQDADGGALTSSNLRPIPEVLRRLPEVVVGRVAMRVVIVVALLSVPALFSPGTVNEFTTAVIFAMVALSLVVLSGWGGSISLGQFGIAGVGGVVAADLVAKSNVDLFLALTAAGITGALMAVVIGIPALRIRGLFLAVTTLAFAVALDSFFLNPTNFDSLLPSSFQRPVLWKRFDLQGINAYYFFCLAILGLMLAFVSGLRATRAGRTLLATRDNQRAASAMSVPTVRVKLVGFVLAGVIAGVAGGLYALNIGSVGFHTFDAAISLLLFSAAVIGGLSSLGGAMLGVMTIQVATHAFPKLQLLITGTGLLLLLLVLPGGLGEALQKIRDLGLRAVANRRGLIVPSLVADRADHDGTGHVRAPKEDALLTRALSGGAMEEAAAHGHAHATSNGHASTNGHGASNGHASTNGHGALVPVPEPEPEVVAATVAGTPILSCRAVEVSYGQVQILFGVDLDVAEGEIVALLGTNGAGKSTLLKGVTSLAPVGKGAITFEGKDITGIRTDATARLGMALMPGGRGIFPTLSVDENLRLGAWLLRKDKAATNAATEEAYDRFAILRDRRNQLAGDLSGGEQQMLSMSMALMTKPRLLMIDELSLGLAPTIVSLLLKVVRDLHAQGVTIVVVEQSINVALELAERAVFLEKGEVRFSGPTADLLERPDVLRAVFIAGADAITGDGGGTKGSATAPDVHRVAPGEDAPVILETLGATKRFGGITAVGGVDIQLREGEILGLIGHNGAGKTTLFDLVSGFLPLDGGRIVLGGTDIGEWPAHARAVAGLGRSFQEAKLYPSLTTAEVIGVALERHLASKDMVAAGLRLPASLDSEAEVTEKVEELIDLLGLRAFKEKLVGELSTGTRRIIELACILAQDPAVVLLDEPSGGVAQKETEALGPLLRRVQEQTGCSILVIEHDMPLLSGLCDRLIALELGEVIVSGTPTEVLEHPRVIESYLGTEESTINRSGAAAKPVAAAGPAVIEIDAATAERHRRPRDPDGRRRPVSARR